VCDKRIAVGMAEFMARER